MIKICKIIMDDNSNTFEIVTGSSNELLTSNVIEMMNIGMKIQCQSEAPVDGNKYVNYTLEENLYNRLIDEYEQKTKKNLKKW